VLDRSGSMQGAPFAAARDAARRFCRLLRAEDRITLVAFDTEVRTVLGPTAGDDPRLATALTSLDTGASTNLAGGWTTGRDHVAGWRGNGVNRVILLTDGIANVGVTAPDALAELAREARGRGVSTTCIGFGPRFNEDLLRAMSAAGGGHFWYVERVDQMGAIFEEEIEGLVALAARNVTVHLELDHLGASEVSLVQPLPMFRLRPRSLQVQPGDLYATSPLDLCFTFRIADASATGALGRYRSAGTARQEWIGRNGSASRVDLVMWLRAGPPD
jgi:Ca-activated chloride channel family protein